MKRFIKLFILIAVIIMISGCNYNKEGVNKIKKSVLSAFEEEGIELTAKEQKSQTFDFSHSQEENYEFEGGTIYLFYGFNQTEMEQIKENIRSNLAEIEFMYPPQMSYNDTFALMFIPNTSDIEINNKVNLVFSGLNN